MCRAFLCILLIAPIAHGQTTRAAERPGQCHALIVAGMPGTPTAGRRFADWAGRFQTYLTKSAGVPAANVVMLGVAKETPATLETITRAIATMAASVAPEDQFVLILIGHGGRGDANASFVLNGADLDSATLAGALAAIRADNQVILNLAGGGGDFLPALAARGRVNISSTAAGEPADPIYGEFFLRAIESRRADGEGKSAKDGAVTLLEAYNWSAHQTALWICRQVALKDGSWRLDGKESVEIFKKLYAIPPDGGAADTAHRLSPDSDGSREDQIVPIVVPPDLKPDNADYWAQRRVLNEHAQLEDTGRGDISGDAAAGSAGVSALTAERGYEPIVPAKAGDPGYLAARIVLGQPRPLTAEKH